MWLPESDLPRVVIVGAGFGGINLAKRLRHAPCRVLLVDANNFHQFQPLLYQVATCGLEPDSIIFPLRKLFDNQDNISIRMGLVESVDTEAKRIQTTVGYADYDVLVLATGSTTNFFGSEELESRCIGMKDIRESLDIRSMMLQNLETAANTADPAERDALTNFVVVGGGPAGVETVGALAEFKRYILADDYPELPSDLMNLYLVQSGGALLKGMSEKAQRAAKRDLENMDVEIVFETRVKGYDGCKVTTNTDRVLNSRAVIWTAGVKGTLPEGIDSEQLTRGNRVEVDAFNRVRGMEDVFAIGDVASQVSSDWEHGLPGVAPVAIQQGRHLAKNLVRRWEGEDMRAFMYVDKGSLATIGKKRAVADLGKIKLTGWIAWVIWSVVHVLSLIGFKNKVWVFLSWMISYINSDKGNRFIIRKYTDVHDPTTAVE